MSKRNDIIKYLLDLGLDVDTQNDEIRGYLNEQQLLSIKDWMEYRLDVFVGFKEYFGNKASEIFMKMAEYSCINIEDRRK